MRRKVYLDGELGGKFGRELSLDVDSFADVFRLLECNNPEVRQYLKECHDNNIGFMLKVEDTPLTVEEEIVMKFSSGDMYISPIPAGSGGSPLGKIFAAILIVVAVVLYPPSLAWVGQLAFGVAASLAIAGLAELMAPDPATDEGFTQDQSYLFQGSGQTILEGDPVPVLYGRLRVPGRLIDFDVRNTNSYYKENGFGISGTGLGVIGSEDGGGQITTVNESIVPDNASQPAIPGQDITTVIDSLVDDNNKADLIFDPRSLPV